MGHKLGIDLGGTKTEVLVLDPEGQTVFQQRVTSPAQSYDAILDLISTLVREAETELGLRASVGIGIPGAISPRTGLLRNSNTVCMNGRPFASDLEARLEREVRIENDAKLYKPVTGISEAVRVGLVPGGTVIGSPYFTSGGLINCSGV
mgnify:CR=1 FL=1